MLRAVERARCPDAVRAEKTARYRASPAVATDRALAPLALWAADAIAAGRLAPADADATFTLMFVTFGDLRDGPDLSDDAHQLLLEGMTLHDWGTEFSADLDELRRLAFAILTREPGAGGS